MAVMLMLVGIGLIGVLTATVASFFVEEKQDEASARLEALESRLERIEGLLGELVTRPLANGSGADSTRRAETD